jgi:hypothetical protein
MGIIFFPQKLSEALAGTLGELHATAVPGANQMGHRLGGRYGCMPNILLAQGFKRLAHHVRLAVASLTRDPVEQGRGGRVNPDV